MALANIAVLLAQMGLKVLAVDWDLEAPGLDRYFKDYLSVENRENPGLIDLLHDALDNSGKADWRNFTTLIKISNQTSFSLIKSGKRDEEYARKILEFEWSYFFKECHGSDFIESLREDWLDEFDVTLIDSRTGVTDSGGICTIQLPDILTLVFTANSQSLEGVIDIAYRAQKGRQQLAYDRMPLTILPLPSRFDSRAQFEESQQWLQIFARDLKPFYDDWLPREYEPIQVLQLTKLPYIAYFSFGEKLPVIDPGVSDPESLGYSYNVAAKLIYEMFNSRIIGEIISITSRVDPHSNAMNENDSSAIISHKSRFDERGIKSHILSKITYEKIDVDIKAISNINTNLEAVNEIAEYGLLSNIESDDFQKVKEEINALNLSELNTSLRSIATRTRSLLNSAKKALNTRRGAELLNPQALKCLDQQLEIIDQLQIDLEEGSDLADWLDINIQRIADKLGRETLKYFPAIQQQISQQELKSFCLSLRQFLEQIAHSLRWGRPDILDSPNIPLVLNHTVYAEAFKGIKIDFPPHVTDEAKSQFKEYVDYLIGRFPTYL